MCLGFILGSMSGNPDSGWYGVAMVGFLPVLSIAFIWTNDSNKKK